MLRQLTVTLRLLATADATSGKRRSDVLGDVGGINSVSPQETLLTLGSQTR